MRSLSMSNTRSSLPRARSAQYAAVREIVAERLGQKWCLFLDRDGVLNRQIVGDYVRSWRDFEWLPDVPRALKLLREWAPHLVVVTNQQGVGKGLMGSDDLTAIHDRLQADLAEEAVVIDAFQVCPHLEAADCACRKPRPGLVLDWLANHPGCQSSLSIMVGDSQSDIGLARNVATVTGGCASIQVGEHTKTGEVADASFHSLWDFAVAVAHARVENS